MVASERKREAVLKNLAKAHEKRRREGTTDKQREAARANIAKAQARERTHGPTDEQRETSRNNISKAHNADSREKANRTRSANIKKHGLSDKQKAHIKKMHEARGYIRRTYRLTFSRDFSDTIADIRTMALSEVRGLARGIALDEYYEINRDILKSYHSHVNTYYLQSVEVYAHVYDSETKRWSCVG